MNYSEFQPAEILKSIVECYWAAEGEDGATAVQKIVPDGFTEIIFHFGDPYKFRKADGKEKIQSRILLAGQITQPVYLTPTGRSGVIGIKFKPAGIWKLFGWNMEQFTDDTIDLNLLPKTLSEELIKNISTADSSENKVKSLEAFLLQYETNKRSTIIDGLLHEIDTSLGNITIGELNKKYTVPIRKMERLFKEQVGVSAKRYARIVRFRHIFQLLQKGTWSKAEATYLAGYFDQSHFNKEFRAFSGEDPGTYFAQHHEFANFFLNRPVVFLQD